MSSQLGKARLGSENLSPAPPTPAPRKDGRRTLPSPWLLRWSLGASGQTVPKAHSVHLGLQNSQKGDRPVLSQQKLETNDVCCVTWDSLSCLRFPSLGKNKGTDQDAASGLPSAL